jgi:hypothetical protein
VDAGASSQVFESVGPVQVVILGKKHKIIGRPTAAAGHA